LRKENERLEKKAASGIMVTLLLLGMFMLAFNIQPVKAEETIYIKPCGEVEPQTVPIQRDGNLYTFTDNIIDRIVVQRNNIIIDGKGYTLQSPAGSYYGFDLSFTSNVTVKNTFIKGFSDFGVFLYSCRSNTIVGNTLSNNGIGINLYLGNDNTISGNTLSNNGRGINVFVSTGNLIEGNTASKNSGTGIDIHDSSNTNIVRSNTISENSVGIGIRSASNNRIYHNNFIGNTNQAEAGDANSWDNGYPSGGNYWSDYTIRYPDAHELDDSGIWDTPYVIDENNRDYYPLMNPWTPTPPPPPSDFSITASPAVLTIEQGASDTSIITIGSLKGFNQQVELTVTSESITGVTTTLNPLLVTPPPNEFATSVLTVEVATDAVLDEYVITVTGTSGSLQHSVNIALRVVAPPPPPPVVMTTVDIDPDTVNLRSKGQWITTYIQLPEGYDAANINASTILLNGTISPVLDPKYDFVTNSSQYLVDHSGDGILERMVKFNRTAVEYYIYHTQGISYGNVALTITGQLLDGTPFEGTDTIFVNYAGDANNDGTINMVDLSVVSAHWYPGPPTGILGYNANADFNNDATINILDLAILSANWGQKVPSAPT